MKMKKSICIIILLIVAFAFFDSEDTDTLNEDSHVIYRNEPIVNRDYDYFESTKIQTICYLCGGSGYQKYKCSACGGSGIDPAYESTKGSLLHGFAEKDCSKCSGTGYPVCEACWGKGYVD